MLKTTGRHMPSTGVIMLNKLLVGVLLLLSTLAVGAWPLTVPAQSATATEAIQTKGSIAKVVLWPNGGMGYELSAGSRPVCTRLRNLPADDTGDPFCKTRGPGNAFE